MKKSITFFILLILAFKVNYAKCEFKYKLNVPDIKHELPAILNEVSGISDIDFTRVALIQDELGIVFIYDFIKGEILSQHKFEETGDFEGLAFTGNSIYILRSDGRLSEWRNFMSDSAELINYYLDLKTNNNEGLCFDSKHNQVLIAAKSKPRSHDLKEERFIYSFDLNTKKLLDNPLYSLNVSEIQKLADKLNIHFDLTSAKGKQKAFNFRPASIAIHPISDEIYIISAVEKLILIMNRGGDLVHIEKLDEQLFLQAEGITFLPDGTMIITNEARGKQPTLLVFKMKE